MLAIYDMDKTITRRPSWMPWLLFFARTQAPWRLLLVPLMLLPSLAYLLGALDRGGLKQATQWLMMGRRVHRNRVERAAAAFAARFGAANELPGALAAIAADRAAGARLLLATASCRYYAEALAARWGFDDVVATENVWDGDWLTPKLHGQNCYDAAKLTMLLAAIPARPEPLSFTSDHVSDLPTLLWADKAIAANPSAALAAEATGRGWPIVEWMGRRSSV